MKKYLAYYETEWPANIAELTAVENKPFVGYLGGTKEVKYTVIPEPVTGPADNEIWYRTNNNLPVSFYVIPVSKSRAAVYDSQELPQKIEDQLMPGTMVSSDDASITYTVMSHEYNENTGYFVIAFDKTVTKNCISLGYYTGGSGGYITQSAQNITEMLFPKTTTYIQDWSFGNAGNLEKIDLGQSIEVIGAGAFVNTNLLNLTIPNSVKILGCGWSTSDKTNNDTTPNFAIFDYCTLKEITFTGTKTEWNNIKKSNNWTRYSHITTIHCTDGDIII